MDTKITCCKIETFQEILDLKKKFDSVYKDQIVKIEQKFSTIEFEFSSTYEELLKIRVPENLLSLEIRLNAVRVYLKKSIVLIFPKKESQTVDISFIKLEL